MRVAVIVCVLVFCCVSCVAARQSSTPLSKESMSGAFHALRRQSLVHTLNHESPECKGPVAIVENRTCIDELQAELGLESSVSLNDEVVARACAVECFKKSLDTIEANKNCFNAQAHALPLLCSHQFLECSDLAITKVNNGEIYNFDTVCTDFSRCGNSCRKYLETMVQEMGCCTHVVLDLVTQDLLMYNVDFRENLGSCNIAEPDECTPPADDPFSDADACEATVTENIASSFRDSHCSSDLFNLFFNVPGNHLFDPSASDDADVSAITALCSNVCVHEFMMNNEFVVDPNCPSATLADPARTFLKVCHPDNAVCLDQWHTSSELFLSTRVQCSSAFSRNTCSTECREGMKLLDEHLGRNCCFQLAAEVFPRELSNFISQVQQFCNLELAQQDCSNATLPTVPGSTAKYNSTITPATFTRNESMQVTLDLSFDLVSSEARMRGFKTQFADDVSVAVGISVSRIEFLQVMKGSVIVQFKILAPPSEYHARNEPSAKLAAINFQKMLLEPHDNLLKRGVVTSYIRADSFVDLSSTTTPVIVIQEGNGVVLPLAVGLSVTLLLLIIVAIAFRIKNKRQATVIENFRSQRVMVQPAVRGQVVEYYTEGEDQVECVVGAPVVQGNNQSSWTRAAPVADGGAADEEEDPKAAMKREQAQQQQATAQDKKPKATAQDKKPKATAMPPVDSSGSDASSDDDDEGPKLEISRPKPTS